jgi:hypothetical protein
MVAACAKTLLLLSLWDLEGLEQAVPQSKILNQVKKKGEKTTDYAEAIASLVEIGAIERSSSSSASKISLTPIGLTLLGESLQDAAWAFDGTIVRAKTANALLRWIRTRGTASTTQIESYEAFKTTAIATFDKLNRDFNLDNFVPIYRIRRAIGNQVERSNFNSWLLKMQSEDIFQLLEGSIEDSSPDKLEDSVRTPLGKLRCYAKRLAA